MLYSAGRVLQMLGLFILPVAIAGNVLERMSLKESLELSTVGVVIFVAGWLLQQASRKR